ASEAVPPPPGGAPARVTVHPRRGEDLGGDRRRHGDARRPGRRGRLRAAHPHRHPTRGHRAPAGGRASVRGARAGGGGGVRWDRALGRSPRAAPPPRGAALSVSLASPRGRGILLASIVGSGMAFLDGTAVNVALPALARGLGADLAGLQWTLDAYLVTLCAFLLTGGSLGDRLGRRPTFELGAVGFAGASLLCGLSPSVLTLTLARAVQGVAAALLVPVSLSLVRADIDEKDQGRALGLWTGLSGVTSALGPLVGGWLVQAVSWRAIFFLNLPLAVVAVPAAHRCLPGGARAPAGETPGPPRPAAAAPPI